MGNVVVEHGARLDEWMWIHLLYCRIEKKIDKIS
jgi:hypothetical protein